MKQLFLAAALVLCILALSSCKKDQGTASSTGKIVIGEYASLTGGTATFGTSSHEGIMLAVEQINKAGGVLGREIDIKTEDDRSDANEAVTAVEKLINRDKVVAMLGEVASTRSLAGGGVCQKAHIPMLSSASTNPDVTWDKTKGQVKDYIFRACFTDDFQGAIDAKFAIGKGWKRIAVLTDANSDYSKGLAKVFKETFGKSGEMMDESFRSGDKDFRSQLTKIAAWNPDAVFVPGYYGDVCLLLPQARNEIGMKVPFFGGDGWDSPETLALGAVANGCFYCDHYSPDDPRPEVVEFIKTYRARYNNKTPDAMAVLGYDSMRVMADAITRAGKAEPQAIRDALATTKDFKGVSGSITLDEKHNARKPLVILELKDGKTKLVETIAP
jgi:branched-chain amino acid transport system substrate-binding protein